MTSLNEEKIRKIAEILNDNSSIIKELNSKQNELYERLLSEKDRTIQHLKNEVKSLIENMKK